MSWVILSWIDTSKIHSSYSANRLWEIGNAVEIESIGLGSQLNVREKEKELKMLKTESEKLGGEQGP